MKPAFAVVTSGLLNASLLASALLLVGCTFENSGLSYDHFSVSATHDDGTAAALLRAPLCVTLPVLIGSIVEERRGIEGSLGVRLRATSEEVEVDFSGQAGGTREHHRILREQVSGYRRELTLQTREGTVLEIVLVGGCPSSSSL